MRFSMEWTGSNFQNQVDTEVVNIRVFCTNPKPHCTTCMTYAWDGNYYYLGGRFEILCCIYTACRNIYYFKRFVK